MLVLFIKNLLTFYIFMPRNSAEPTRRDFLKLAAGTGLAAVTRDAEGSRENINAHDVLSKFSFVNQDGKIISGNQLKSMIGASPFTVSFGFEGCTNFCPTGNSVLGSLSKASGGRIKNVMINVNPEAIEAIPTKQQAASGELVSKQFRDSYKKSILTNKDGSKTGADENNLIILYPLDSANKPSNKAAVDISIALGNRTRAGHEYHSAVFGLYSADGKYQSHVILTPNSDHKTVTDQFVSAFRGQGASR
jgi:cytochrome oxidase Cu insertion factor (SCO1/SenC/PrrC family)